MLQKARHKLQKEEDYKKVGLLDLIAQGAGWTDDRKAQANMEVSNLCRFCKQEAGTLLHQVWACPKIKELLGDNREDSKHLEEHYNQAQHTIT